MATPPAAPKPEVSVPKALRARWENLLKRLLGLPEEVQGMATLGLYKTLDFQDMDYGQEYPERLEALVAIDHRPYDLTREAAKYMTNAMAYDDLIRIVDINKTRASRAQSVTDEIKPPGDSLMQVLDYFHPHAEEVIGLMPAKSGTKWMNNPARMALVKRFFDRGWRIRSDGFWGFSLLYLVGGLRGWRRKMLRHR